MALIWTDEDVAALLQTFPPPSLTKEKPTLLRSFSGEHLVQSGAIVGRLEKRLAENSNRLSIRELDHELGVQGADRLLGLVSCPIYFNYARNDQIIPSALAEEIFDELWTVAGDRVVDLEQFATKKDIDIVSLDSLTEAWRAQGRELMDVQTDGSKKHVCQKNLHGRVQDDIANAMRNANDQRCELDRFNRGLSSSKIAKMAKDLLARDETLEGAIDQINGVVTFTPSAYAHAQRADRIETYNSLVNDLTSKLQSQGYVAIEPSTYSKKLEDADKTVQDLIEEIQALEVDVESISSGESTLLAQKSPIEAAITELESLMSKSALNAWTARERGAPVPSFDHRAGKEVETLAAEEADIELYRLLLDTSYRQEISQIFDSRIQDLAEEDRLRFITFFHEKIISPVEAYARGVATASDATLKQHLEEFVGDYFRREYLPEILKTAKNEGLLKDKTRAREVDKMSHACDEAKTLSSILMSVQKCARKLKVEAPSSDTLAQTKNRLLEQRLQVLRKMKRGSDVLQNLIWVLLARETDGLYMSSGKDTTRMIKLYAAVGGHSEAVKKLEGWKELLKSGQESKDIVAEMRELAGKNVEEVVAG